MASSINRVHLHEVNDSVELPVDRILQNCLQQIDLIKYFDKNLMMDVTIFALQHIARNNFLFHPGRVICIQFLYNLGRK